MDLPLAAVFERAPRKRRRRDAALQGPRVVTKLLPEWLAVVVPRARPVRRRRALLVQPARPVTEQLPSRLFLAHRRGGSRRVVRRPAALQGPRFVTPFLVDWGRRHGAIRGLYRIFSPAVFRFYRSQLAPPQEGDPFFTTNASLPATPGTSFADGTWFLSVSYWNGVLDSGFLAIGPSGETWVELVVASGGAGAALPAAPLSVALERRAGGVVRVVALYAETGASRASTWAIAYTTDGSSPPAGAPSATRAFTNTTGPQVLVYDLPAQADGTTVKVLVQTRRGASTYSAPSAVVTAIADASGPSGLSGGDLWRGQLPDGAP